MQHAHRPQQTFGDGLPLRQGQWALMLKQLREGLARNIHASRSTNADARWPAWTSGNARPATRRRNHSSDSKAWPASLSSSRLRAGFSAARAAAGHRAPGTAMTAGFAPTRFHLPAFKVLPGFQRRWQWPLLQLHQGIAQGRRAEGSTRTSRALALSWLPARWAALTRVLTASPGRFVRAESRNAVIAQGCPHAIAEQQETFAFAQLTVEKVQHQVLIQAEGTLEHMLHARLFPYVVFADALQVRRPASDKPGNRRHAPG